RRSTSVVLPWSTWAMIATLRKNMRGFRRGRRAADSPRNIDTKRAMAMGLFARWPRPGDAAQRATTSAQSHDQKCKDQEEHEPEQDESAANVAHILRWRRAVRRRGGRLGNRRTVGRGGGNPHRPPAPPRILLGEQEPQSARPQR